MLFFIPLVLIGLLTLYMVFKALHDTIDYRAIVDHKLPRDFNGYKVFFISDIHRRKVNLKTIKKIKDKIELVVIGGDLTEKGVPLERTRMNIKRLQSFGAPLYFVWGNHDYEVMTSPLYEMLIEEKVTVLADESELVSRGTDTINLIGFDYHREDEDRGVINWESSVDKYTILLTHVPDMFYRLNSVQQDHINMVLAGHTHGGQIRLFGLGYYKNGGLSKNRATNVLVSEGYGYTFLPFRLETKSQCHLLTFKC